MHYVSEISIINISATTMNKQLETVRSLSFEKSGGKRCIQIVTKSLALKLSLGNVFLNSTTLSWSAYLWTIDH